MLNPVTVGVRHLVAHPTIIELVEIVDTAIFLQEPHQRCLLAGGVSHHQRIVAMLGYGVRTTNGRKYHDDHEDKLDELSSQVAFTVRARVHDSGSNV
jgi:hypothetical protein